MIEAALVAASSFLFPFLFIVSLHQIFMGLTLLALLISIHMLIFYRILGVLLNFIAFLLAISLLFSLPAIFSSPLNMLSTFMSICIVLYAWFTSRFSRDVLLQKKPVKAKLRDWIRVNGIVALIYGILGSIASIALLAVPSLNAELLKNLPSGMPVEEGDLANLFIVMLVFSLILVVHVIFSFWFMRINRAYFSVE